MKWAFLAFLVFALVLYLTFYILPKGREIPNTIKDPPGYRTPPGYSGGG